MMEKEIEAKIQGKQVTEIKLEMADCKDDDRIYCNYCKTSIADFHRSCSICPYELCVACCQDLRKGGIRGNKENVMNTQKSSVPTAMWKPMANGRMPCPSVNRSCCGTLQLKCIYPENWVTGLVVKAEKIGKAYGPNSQPDCSKSMCSCNGKNDIRKAASREDSEDNYLCCLTTVNTKGEDLDHFQRHLSRGEPVIVDDVLETTRRLSWDPMVIWRVWRRIKADIGSSQDMDVIDCLSECQVSVNSYQFFKGYTEGRYDSKGRLQLLKLYNWPYSDTFEERLPRHAAEFISCLPFKEVTHPHSGYLNLAAKLPKESSKLDLGPNIYIAYGFPHELGVGDSVVKLQCATADVVNVLLHSEAVTVALTSEQLLAIKKEKQEQILQIRKQSSEDKGFENLPANRFKGPPGFNNVKLSSTSSSCRCDDEEADVLWDVFRRQDIRKLKEYLNSHFREFTHTFGTVLKQVYHPIHDQTFYLSMDHKRKLKEEYGIEPWTVTQKVGEAVIIPAGCAYQIRNLKSCISVCLDFISPESANEAIRLTEEFRDLPEHHIAKEDRLEVKKLILHSLSSAIKDFERSSKSDRDMHNEDSSLIGSLSEGESGSPSSSPRRMNSISSVSDEVILAPCKQENLTTPEIHPVHQPWVSPSPVSEAEIEIKNVDMGRVESALKKLQALSAAKSSHRPSSLKAGDVSKNSSPLILAKKIWDDFIKSPLKVFGNLSNEMTTMHAISMLIENPSLFDEKEAKLILDIQEIVSSVVQERGMKEQLERKNKQEFCELEKFWNNIDNLMNSVSSMKVEYDELLLQEHELEKQKQEIENKIRIIGAKRKRTGDKMEEESARAEEVISVAEDKEAETKSNKEKMAEADSVIDSLMSRFFAVRSQYARRC